MERKDILAVSAIAVVIAALTAAVVASFRSEGSEGRKVYVVRRGKGLGPLAGDPGAGVSDSAEVIAQPAMRPAIKPNAVRMFATDQFAGGYRPIGTARAQADDNDAVFILSAKPADSRHRRFWYRVQCAVSDRFCDVYLDGIRDRLETGQTLAVSELPNDTPLVVSVTEAWYLYG